ncbi:MAG: DUF349 domain-containing protein [Promicromonosporaceae bacterium]|nr:DUF349 domain-containing protein [Promicromonosporaceae bacterium]
MSDVTNQPTDLTQAEIDADQQAAEAAAGAAPEVAPAAQSLLEMEVYHAPRVVTPAGSAAAGDVSTTTTDTEAAPVVATKPAPAPGPAPKPGKPKPSAKPGSAAPRPATPASTLDPARIAEAAKFGEVDPDGGVYVLEATGKRQVGSVPGAAPDDAMRVYIQRYLALDSKVSLFANRLEAADLSVREIDSTLSKLEKELIEPAVVGDLDGLRNRVTALRERAATRRAELDAARAAAKDEATASRTALVERAEALANADAAKVQWKTAGEEFRGLMDTWRSAQQNGPRIDRKYEDELWKRFSAARRIFDQARRQYFSDLDERNASAKVKKEALIKEAEKLSASTDWAKTAGAYRDLMAKWKEAGRVGRKEDDALWAQFRAAQDKFFDARDADNQATDAEFEDNLKKKEALLVEAEALVPIKDLTTTKATLRSIQDRWDAAGKVPRAKVATVENRMRAVEQAVRDAEQAQWVRTNPETKARATGAAAQLEKAIAGLEADLAAAQASGNVKKAAEIEAAITARKAWLEQVQAAAAES